MSPIPRNPRPPYGGDLPYNVPPGLIPRLVALAVVVFVLVLAASTATYVVEPGTRGIKITLGKAADDFLPAGFGFKAPFITSIVPVNVRQKTVSLRAECFSSDLQQVVADLRVLYRVPEKSVVQIYKQYAGDPFDSLIAPRVQEAVKEATAVLTAEQLVKKRDDIKSQSLQSARQKIGEILWVEDIVIRSLELSPELEKAIEAKMVAEQQANQARFTQLQKQVEAQTAVIRARGEAEAITVRGEALKLNPQFIRLEIVERWNGRSPLVVPSNSDTDAAGLLLPLGSPSALSDAELPRAEGPADIKNTSGAAK